MAPGTSPRAVRAGEHEVRARFARGSIRWATTSSRERPRACGGSMYCRSELLRRTRTGRSGRRLHSSRADLPPGGRRNQRPWLRRLQVSLHLEDCSRAGQARRGRPVRGVGLGQPSGPGRRPVVATRPGRRAGLGASRRQSSRSPPRRSPERHELALVPRVRTRVSFLVLWLKRPLPLRESHKLKRRLIYIRFPPNQPHTL